MSTTQDTLMDKYALISKLIIDDKQPITWIFRDEPETDDDSGWRILSGEENEDFFEDPEDSFVGITITELLQYDSTLKTLIESPYNSEFERINDSSPWQVVTDDLE